MRRRSFQMSLRERRKPSVVKSKGTLWHARFEGAGEGAAADVLGRDQHRVSRELGGAALQPLGGQQDHIGMEEQGVSPPPPRTSHNFLEGFRLGATTNK
jgi:hypothetical protein